MAKPAFIYAFDNLGPDRFTELCGLLLGSRHKGFLLGGVGPDGGIDGEIGEWHSETLSPLLNELIPANQLVVFQFKHKTTARLGQVASRSELLGLYTCSPKKTCELHRTLIQQKHPDAYVLVTNVEVNAPFRSKFIEQCKKEHPGIAQYQIIGLDELEMWVTMMPEIRHLYFPTIFGSSRFELRLKISYAQPTELLPLTEYSSRHILKDVLCISALNVGLAPSYVDSIHFTMIADGKRFIVTPHLDSLAGDGAAYNSTPFGWLLEPGRKHAFFFSMSAIAKKMRQQGERVFPDEFHLYDEIGNLYSESIPQEFREDLMKMARHSPLLQEKQEDIEE